MKYILRLLVLPFWVVIYLVFVFYLTFKGTLKMCYGFVLFGGEQITYDKKLNRDTIISVYQKIEDMEVVIKVDPRSQCNHVWEQEVGHSQTTTPRQKCVICGVQVNSNQFTQ